MASSAQTHPLIRLMANLRMTSREGDQLLKAGQFEAAEAKYRELARDIVGSNFSLPLTSNHPSGGVVCDQYWDMDSVVRTNLMGCYVGIAKCLWRKKETEMALAWLEEANSLYRCQYSVLPQPVFDWMDSWLDLPEATLFRSSALCLSAEIFSALGNSATATMRQWVGQKTALNSPPPDHTPELEAAVDKKLLTKMMGLHPNPNAPPTKGPLIPGLQVQGSWKRLAVKTLGGPTEGREAFACFIWNGHLYVAGGRRSSMGPFHRDLWKLNLSTRDEWEPLPAYPFGLRSTGLFVGWQMFVHDNQAILFTGRSALDVFNLTTEQWSTQTTTFSPTPADVAAGITDSWFYPGTHQNFATLVYAATTNKLYVFGGEHGKTMMGCNLFMELDLLTWKWRRLSGWVRTPRQAPDYSCPGPRKSAAAWAGADGKRIFLLGGHYDREAAKSDEFHRASEAFGYDDFWSFAVGTEKWRRERQSGNPPCSRTEFAYVYNHTLKRVVVFGGYHPSLPTLDETNKAKPQLFQYSYFADTFLYDPAPTTAPSTPSPSPVPTFTAPKWQQVLTPGFPTYRCQSHLVVDPDTGRTYLFGGWTNNQYIPTHAKIISRSFGDLWELRMDLPGGHFDEVDVEEEMRVARAGPWQRCYNCASAGPWKKCGGSCKGRVFFCGPACLKEGWSEHKTKHACRKA
ncbi:hypothetical protein R3P38DRAFT_2882711 [Favolaschia claudopus]|uniref:MYND-type domain-containing protein n=1 Tax=Favolaschia claudopus TaxID=2862362 RepID=A0AAW0D5G3_9AGAR